MGHFAYISMIDPPPSTPCGIWMDGGIDLNDVPLGSDLYEFEIELGASPVQISQSRFWRWIARSAARRVAFLSRNAGCAVTL